MNNKPQRSIISTGTTSIVLIFVLLCMLTFSVLSLVSAQANLRLSQKSADRTTAYYEAENEANTILIRINQTIENVLDSKDADTFYKQLRTQEEGKDGIVFEDENHLTYQVPLDNSQYLQVALTLSFDPLPNGSHYQITSWNTGSNYEWEPDASMSLMQEEAVPGASE